jgi:hypothetical protein
MGFRRAIIPAGSGLPPAIGPSRPRRGDGTRTSHLHVAGPQQWVGSLAVTEVADMQSAIAAALGRR